MDVFNLRDQLTQDYAAYASSFIQIHDHHIYHEVDKSLREGIFWPNPLIQLNPAFARGGTVEEMVSQGILHPECSRIFRKNKAQGVGQSLHLHQHQREAVEIARAGHNYLLTTGTGSGKSLAYIIPIVDHVLRRGSGKGIQAIIVYPMNALANSQEGELKKFLCEGYPEGSEPVTFARYTGQEGEKERQRIIANPPDILLTNYVMLELIMTRPRERRMIERAKGLRFLVLDELHTYRGRQGADVALLVRRVRNRLESPEQKIIFVGTSATLASPGSHDEQRQQVAEVGSLIFGAPFQPAHTVGETLRRTTYTEQTDAARLRELKTALQQADQLVPPTDHTTFIQHPISIWIEETFGLREVEGRLVRQQPRSIWGEQGAVHELSTLTGIPEPICGQVLERWLLAGYECEPNPETGFAPFAFRLHQFISPGDTVYTTLEPEDTRYITLRGQQFVPGNRERVLYPLCFCRECGQEYYSVRLAKNEDEQRYVIPRDFNDRLADESSEAGYLYLSTDKPWPDEFEQLIERLPDDWLEERDGVPRIRSHRRQKLPLTLHLDTVGIESRSGQVCVYIASPFMFCLRCGVSYAARQGDFGKLATLSSEGRSSATTILSLSAIRTLKTSDLPEHAQKLLSFTDNRQDASLQAGHFNDFIEVSLLRGAIYRAVNQAGGSGLTHEMIAEKVFDALNLPVALYASDPSVRF
ncbi:MAG: DEAD/DEAH box helicase, partial [Anaerolineae bacterium]|nr:DEAD/DEAH box helicase [Anaerolineae bacterium]